MAMMSMVGIVVGWVSRISRCPVGSMTVVVGWVSRISRCPVGSMTVVVGWVSRISRCPVGSMTGVVVSGVGSVGTVNVFSGSAKWLIERYIRE